MYCRQQPLSDVTFLHLKISETGAGCGQCHSGAMLTTQLSEAMCPLVCTSMCPPVGTLRSTVIPAGLARGGDSATLVHGMIDGDRGSGMDFDTLAQTRRSIRGYKPDPVPRTVIEEIIRVAKNAPSSMNPSLGTCTC